jgi:antitoxin HicB
MAAQHSYTIVLEHQEGGGFTVSVPELPEVVTEGDTEEEARANAEEAIRAILAYRHDHQIA